MAYVVQISKAALIKAVIDLKLSDELHNELIP